MTRCETRRFTAGGFFFSQSAVALNSTLYCGRKSCSRLIFRSPGKISRYMGLQKRSILSNFSPAAVHFATLSGAVLFLMQ